MPDDYTLEHTWELVERLSNEAPVDILETEHGLDFKNFLGDVVYTIFIAGTE